MGCDLVTALGASSASGHTLVGVNHFGIGSDGPNLFVLSAKEHAVGEFVDHARVKIPQVRQTARVLGWQAPSSWGLAFGCNEHRVAVGMNRWKSRLPRGGDGLDGGDLVRLALERGSCARAAKDVLCELIERHGQSTQTSDHIFTVADCREAFLIEAAGTHWAILECQKTRAVSDAGLIRQDWQRLSCGLADRVVECGWGRNDGSKLDFHAAVNDSSAENPAALKRWSRASLALAQQDGAIDPYCLRRLLLEHFDQCQDLLPRHHVWQGSQIAVLGADVPSIVWASPAHIGAPLFFPLFPAAPLPGQWLDGLPPLNRLWSRNDTRTQEIQDALQATYDQDVEGFLIEARQLKDRPSDVVHRAQEMMARHTDLYLKNAQPARAEVKRPASRSDEQFAFISE